MTRLPSAIVTAGLLRAAEAVGGNGAVLAKGDPDGGALFVILTSRGTDPMIFERVSSMNGGFTWNNHNAGQTLDLQSVARFIDERKRFDRDLWIVELDIAEPEQFIADTLGGT